MYAIRTSPLIAQLKGIVKQHWYADNYAATGDLCRLRQWWNL